MRILIVGSGGREYSIALSLRNDVRVKNLFFYPGNGATRQLGENITTKSNDIHEKNSEIVAFCKNNAIDLVIIGPEAPLMEGLSNALVESNIKTFAPSKKAAMLEGSKIFMKNILKKYKIPTADFMEGSDEAALFAFIDKMRGENIVVKADGLCAGKGVIIAKSKAEAKEAVSGMLSGKLFGEAGESVVVEEFLDGFELSVFAICDGENFITLPVAQDHKRLLDNDLGPNTGGMGAYSPTPQCNEQLLDKIKNTIIKPTLNAMKSEGCEFSGVLFCGIMVVDETPFVLEFNVRFGDPECEVILPLLKTPLLDIIMASLDKKLANFTYEVKSGFCVGVVAASKDYPFKSSPKEKISFEGVNCVDNSISHISFAGVESVLEKGLENDKNKNGEILASGGRVLVGIGLGDSLIEAKNNAYEILKKVQFNGMQYRSDIANKALK